MPKEEIMKDNETKPVNSQEEEFVWNETVCSPEFSCIEAEEDSED